MGSYIDDPCGNIVQHQNRTRKCRAMTSPTFRYLFDPLCGWCYASAPALAALADRYGDRIQMMPSGLFAGGGTRAIAQIADHATRTDKLIAEKTRQVDSDAYFR